MSVIETPPKDRLSINTVVAPFKPELIRSALELELGRGGQVYFLHNRVDSIWARAAMLQELAPNARIGVGHGQMGEAELERTMLQFMRHEFDILVCTTIIENGLDIPLANTLIVENAERYGLSELYQLRGRVGRSNRRAYAYLLVPPDTELTEVARKRLAALKEFSDLGAGFKIAALDLELRGAGNLLGGEQHGQINCVGFDTYVRLLEETVRELKGEETVPEIHSSLNLGLDIRIPTGGNGGSAAFVGELNLTGIYQLNQTWGLRAGYNLMWIEGVALAPAQTDFTLTSTSGTGLNRGGGLFLHGINLGLEARW